MPDLPAEQSQFLKENEKFKHSQEIKCLAKENSDRRHRLLTNPDSGGTVPPDLKGTDYVILARPGLDNCEDKLG